MTLDRIDNSRGYEPGNCRWATTQQQRMNTKKGTISFEQAEEIRRLRAETGWGVKRIATHLGISVGPVNSVIYLGTMKRPSPP